MTADLLAITPLPSACIYAGNNDRKTFDPEGLRELAESIRDNGLAQPPTVRNIADGQYEIVAGERRFRAINLLGWETIPVIIRDLSDEEASAIMLAENTSRADLNPLEEGQAYQIRQERFGWSFARIAETAGVSVQRVQRRLSLLQLLPEVQTMVKHGHFPLGHAELLHDLDANRQGIALRLFRESPAMPLSRFRQIVGQLRAEQDQDALFNLEEFLTVQVQQAADLACRGKAAEVNVPTRQDLPPVEMTSKDNTAAVISRYIATLESTGQHDEAATLGTLYSALVKGNFLSLP